MDPVYLAYLAEQGETYPRGLARCTVRRHCKTCKATTTHAYLRADVFRDACEDRQHQLERDGLRAASFDGYRRGVGLER